MRFSRRNGKLVLQRTGIKNRSAGDAFDDGIEFPSEVVGVHHRALFRT